MAYHQNNIGEFSGGTQSTKIGKIVQSIKLHPFDASAKQRGIHAEVVQFYCPSSTYPIILLLVLYFIA